MPRWAKSDLAKKTFVSPRVQLLGRFFASVCRSTTWRCPFFRFWFPKGGMAKIWEDFSTSVAEAGRKEQMRISVIRENINAKIAKIRDRRKFNPAKIKACTIIYSKCVHNTLPSKIILQKVQNVWREGSANVNVVDAVGWVCSICWARWPVPVPLSMQECRNDQCLATSTHRPCSSLHHACATKVSIADHMPFKTKKPVGLRMLKPTPAPSSASAVSFGNAHMSRR